MKAEPQAISLRTAAKTVLALWLACSVLFASLLAADHGLHSAVHHDADHSDHQCLAVLLSQGTIEITSFASVVVAMVLLFVGKPLPAFTIFLPSLHYRLLPGRAPPFSLA